MKTASDNKEKVTDAQLAELKTMFERTARKAAPNKGAAQTLIGR
ncbi:MAG TPA: hypothetical protein VMQ44_01270 [Candidatus Saccharimonadales bacterium]|nr:hypothetical protein [Candidatus Saccharimonadales bacterium]